MCKSWQQTAKELDHVIMCNAATIIYQYRDIATFWHVASYTVI